MQIELILDGVLAALQVPQHFDGYMGSAEAQVFTGIRARRRQD
ncbi:MAG: hypothetical protein R3F24_02280 [Gammaproteobacteria bacterium]